MDGDHAIDLEELSREALMDLAKAWRRRALRGDRMAHGSAHACEVVYRRRFGSPSAAPTVQDLRPLAVLPSTRRWRLGFKSWFSP
ncbi:MAG: hypothetical protein EOP12_02325 [Pseudomonas sp.]|nr:MAG: hypothetical protein EOP12_02325 [Pseudomonas sp.]